MRNRALIAACATCAFIVVANHPTSAADYAAGGLVRAFDRPYAAPRHYHPSRPRTMPRWSYDAAPFPPRWRYRGGRSTWRHRWSNRAPYRHQPRIWQPWPRWQDWPSYQEYRGYVAAP